MSITAFSFLKQQAASQDLKLYKYRGYLWLKDCNNIRQQFNTLAEVKIKLSTVKLANAETTETKKQKCTHQRTYKERIMGMDTGEKLDVNSLPQLPLSSYQQFPATPALYFCSSNGKYLHVAVVKNLKEHWQFYISSYGDTMDTTKIPLRLRNKRQTYYKTYELSQHQEVIIEWQAMQLREYFELQVAILHLFDSN